MPKLSALQCGLARWRNNNCLQSAHLQVIGTNSNTSLIALGYVSRLSPNSLPSSRVELFLYARVSVLLKWGLYFRRPLVQRRTEYHLESLRSHSCPSTEYLVERHQIGELGETNGNQPLLRAVKKALRVKDIQIVRYAFAVTRLR